MYMYQFIRKYSEWHFQTILNLINLLTFKEKCLGHDTSKSMYSIKHLFTQFAHFKRKMHVCGMTQANLFSFKHLFYWIIATPNCFKLVISTPTQSDEPKTNPIFISLLSQKIFHSFTCKENVFARLTGYLIISTTQITDSTFNRHFHAFVDLIFKCL